MTIDWYYTFLVLAKHLNYRKASEELFITQPSIFQQIKKLEQHLCIVLFETRGKHIYLTHAGKQFIPVARNLVNTYESVLDFGKELNAKSSDHLTIAVTSYIASYIITDFLPIFFEKEPTIKISIVVQEDEIVKNIEEGVVDIGITRQEPYSKRINCENVCEGKIKLIVPNSQENNDIHDELYYFRNYKILSNNHPTYWDKTLKEIYNLVPEADVIAVDDVKVAEKIIKIKQGISYLPTYILNKSDNTHLLKIIEPNKVESPISFTYLLSYRDTPAILKFKSLFIDYIKNEQQKNL